AWRDAWEDFDPGRSLGQRQTLKHVANVLHDVIMHVSPAEAVGHVARHQFDVNEKLRRFHSFAFGTAAELYDRVSLDAMDHVWRGVAHGNPAHQILGRNL